MEDLLLCFSYKVFILNNFLTSNWLLVGFILLPLNSLINFCLNFLGTGLLYLLDIIMNSSFVSVHHLVYHLDLN